MKTFESITDLVGGTPLLRLGRYAEDKKPVAEIYGKLEYLNPHRQRQGPNRKSDD